MPLKSYAVLKCKVLEGREGEANSPHYQIHGVDPNDIHYRMAVNIHSQTVPPDLLYYCNEYFEHPVIEKLLTVTGGLTLLSGEGPAPALDYIRGNLFRPKEMRILPAGLPGPDNDLNEKIAKYVKWALAAENAELYAFGAAWGPEERSDPYFDFTPGRGIHDIHMNQGNSGQWAVENAPWQDGGLFFHFPAVQRWVAMFLAFQSQSFATHGESGEPLDSAAASPTGDSVRIIAAMINPSGKGRKSITLVNPTNQKIDITDWSLTDNLNFKRVLYGEIKAGEFLTIPLPAKPGSHGHGLVKENGVLSLVDRNGRKIDGVFYTQKERQKEDFTLTF